MVEDKVQIAGANKAEQQLIYMHRANYSRIKNSEIVETWRDENDYLCVRYDNNEWYHYNASTGEWW